MGDEVERFGRAVCEDHLFGPTGRADERGDVGARAFKGGGCFLGGEIHGSMDVGVVALVVLVHGLDHAARREGGSG